MYLILIICGPRLVQKFETTNSPVFPLQTIDLFSEKNCDDALRCPNAPFDSSVLIDYNEGVMTMHSDYMDAFCA